MKHSRNKGFTLIEVLVAFAILGLSSIVIFRAMSTGMTNEQAAISATTNILSARSVLERIGIEIPLEQGEFEGTFADGGAWQLALTRLDDDEGVIAAPLFRAELTVTAEDGRSVNLTTLKLGR